MKKTATSEENMMTKIMEIEGIGPAIAEKLQAAGVFSIMDLLACGGTVKDRKELAAATGIDESTLLKWINHADLFRIRGIGSEYSDLLEQAGVDTVPELGQRNAKALYEALVKANAEKKIVRRLPAADQVSKWIKAAKKLPRVIEY
jgi:predicted flap endonuclease-1-like 5' DNA nuclease